MVRKAIVTLISIGLMTSPSYAKEKKLPKQVRKLLALSVDEVAKSIAISDDELDTSAKLSSQPVFQNKKGLLRIVWDDNFLRAYIDKKTGRTTFQLYQKINYNGDWRHYQRANYSTPDGPVSVEVDRIASDVVSCSGSRYSNGCQLSEHFAFDVPENLLRTMASRHDPEKPLAWRFKYKAKAAEDWQDGILSIEIAGFMKAVDDYKAKLGVPTDSEN